MRLALHASIPAMLARRQRRSLWARPNVKLTVEGYYELILAETSSEEIAAEEASKYAGALEREKTRQAASSGE